MSNALQHGSSDPPLSADGKLSILSWVIDPIFLLFETNKDLISLISDATL
jgi:hypothetical protein